MNFRFKGLVVVALALCSFGIDSLSPVTIPVTSTRWFTCGVSATPVSTY